MRRTVLGYVPGPPPGAFQTRSVDARISGGFPAGDIGRPDQFPPQLCTHLGTRSRSREKVHSKEPTWLRCFSGGRVAAFTVGRSEASRARKEIKKCSLLDMEPVHRRTVLYRQCGSAQFCKISLYSLLRQEEYFYR